MTRPLVLLLGLALLLAGCGSGRARPATPAELARGLEGASAVEVWLPTGVTRDGGSLLARRVDLAARTLAERRGIEVKVLERGEEGDARAARVVLELREAETAAGLSGAVEVPLALHDVLLECREDPERPGLPMTLQSAARPRDLCDYVEDLAPRSRPWAARVRRGDATLEVALDARGQTRGEPEPRGTWGPWLEVGHAPGLRVHRAPEVEEQAAARYLNTVRSVLARVESWTEGRPKAPRRLYLVADGARLRALVGASRLAPPGCDCVALTGARSDDAGRVAARASLRAVLGEPARAWMLDAAAIEATGSWWGRDLRTWGKRLAAGGALPGLEDLTHAAAAERTSQHVLAPLRALLWRWLLEERGAPAAREVWRAGELDLPTDEDFERWLLSAPDSPPATRASLPEGDFLRGVCLPSTLRQGGGMDTAEVGRSLRAARIHGANALGLSSFYAEVVAPPRAPGGGAALGRESLEGDAALAQAAHAARSRGLEVLALHPQLILSESAGYSRHLRRTSPEDWAEFEEGFVAMSKHYALLAELLEVDLLVLGAELSPSTRADADEETQAARAKALAAGLGRARSSFGGALAYLAAWPTEVERFEAWSEVDLVAVTWFPRTSARRAAPLARAWTRELGRLAERFAEAQVDWLLYEVGVPASERGLEDARFSLGPHDAQLQAVAVRALGTALDELSDSPRPPRGLFWWCWSPDPGHLSPYDLQARPARVEFGRLGRAR